MVFDISTAMTWILFLALFPMAFIWLRRAWRIFINKDHSEVALKKGVSPPNPKRWAPVTGMINLTAGIITLGIIIGIPLWIATGIAIGPFHDFKNWNALAGSTIWLKIIADFIVSRQAHPFVLGKKKNP
jgi:ABC-type phosphate transport system permease subunit